MFDPIIVMLTLLILFFLASLIFGEMRNARGIFVLFMVAGAFLPFVLAVVTGVESPMSVRPLDSPNGVKAVVLCGIAMGVVIYTSLIVERTYLRRRTARVYGPNAPLANLFSLLSILMSVIYVSGMVLRLGGLTQMIVRLYQRVSLFDSVANYLTILYFASVVFAVFSFAFSRGSRSRSARWFSYVAVLICFVQTLMLGGRSLVVLLGVALFYVSLTRMSILKFTFSAVIASILIAITSFTMANARFVAQDAAVLTQRTDESFLSRATTGLTFVDHVAVSIDYVKRFGHDFGQTYANILLLPVPRDLWPDKPLQISVQMRGFLFHDLKGGEPPGLFGEGYIAFGTLGVLLAAILLGYLIGRINVTTIQSRMTGCRAREACAGLLAPLIAYGLVRGGLDIGSLRVGIPAFWCFVAIKIADLVIGVQRRRTSKQARFDQFQAARREGPRLS